MAPLLQAVSPLAHPCPSSLPSPPAGHPLPPAPVPTLSSLFPPDLRRQRRAGQGLSHSGSEGPAQGPARRGPSDPPENLPPLGGPLLPLPPGVQPSGDSAGPLGEPSKGRDRLRRLDAHHADRPDDGAETPDPPLQGHRSPQGPPARASLLEGRASGDLRQPPPLRLQRRGNRRRLPPLLRKASFRAHPRRDGPPGGHSPGAGALRPPPKGGKAPGEVMAEPPAKASPAESPLQARAR